MIMLIRHGDLASTFTHSVAQGAGWSAGRALTHAVQSQFGIAGIIVLVVLFALLRRRRR